MTPSVSSKEVNAPGGKGIFTSSKFNLSYTFADTYQFGIIKPCQVSDIVPRDKKFAVHCGHDARSFNLKAPLMQDVNLYKAHVAVPMCAILPRNWDKFFDMPVIGEDVPDDCGCGVANFSTLVRSRFIELSDDFSTAYQAYIADRTKLAPMLDALFAFYQFGSLVYSNGCLLSSLGAHFGSVKNCNILIDYGNYVNKLVSFDRFFEILFSQLSGNLSRFIFTINGEEKEYVVVFGTDINASNSLVAMNFRQFLTDYLYDGVISVQLVDSTGLAFTDFTVNGLDTWQIPNVAKPFNIARLWAYQLACSHFFTNDKIDYVFSAELFRQLVGSYIADSLSLDTFEVNGMTYEYDYLSAHYFSAFMQTGSFFGTTNYLLSLLSYRHSLKFMDYFTGGRTRPLAFGDVLQNVDVEAGQSYFNVIDLAANTWTAKFRQYLMRYGSKARNYIKGVFGVTPAYDFHDPMWLGKTRDKIYSVETDNTASEQLTQAMTTTAQFRSNGDRFAFTFDADRASIIVSLVYFDIDRLYVDTIERQFFAVDRFDYFNPWTQYLGDQPIYKAEVSSDGDLTPWGYTNRNQEYKTRFNQAAGGFVEFLPGWAFLADKNSPTNLTPRFIRSSPSEMDRFYNSLVNFTPAGYFHFILKNRNTITAVRPMAFNPIVSF